MRHRKGYERLPVLRTSEPPSGFQPFVERRRWQWRYQAKDRQPRRPTANFLQSSLRYARLVIVHAEDKRGDCINVTLGEAIKHCGILTWLVEAFLNVAKVGWIDGFHPDEDPLATRGGYQIHQFLI